MVRRRADNAAVTQQTYALRPVRSRTTQLVWYLVMCLLAIMAGAVGMMGYVKHHHLPAALCVVASGATDDAQVQLERTKLALEQKTAECAAVQKTANTSAAEVAQLNTELQFLRQQARR